MSNLIKVSWYEAGKTHETVVGDVGSLFSLVWLLDNSDDVKQWNLGCAEGEFRWAIKSNWKKWKSWKEWEY